MTQTLRDYAAEQLDEALAEYGPLLDDRDQAIDRWLRQLVSVGNIPDNILAAMPEVSRHNEPQISPQEYECGCVVITRITDRDCRTWWGYDEKPFEMRLALPCDKATCELAHLRTMTTDKQIKTLRAEAAQAGDHAQTLICDIATGAVDPDEGYEHLHIWSLLSKAAQRKIAKLATTDAARAICAETIKAGQG